MKTTLYYQVMHQRRNPLKDAVVQTIYSILSIPKMTLEVFTRKSFGERYFSLFTGIGATIGLAILPFTFDTTDKYPFRLGQMIGDNIVWYLALIGFVVAMVMRYVEILREPSVFEFGKYSLSQGVHQKWFKSKVLSYIPWKYTKRQVDTFLEPGFFFILGLLVFFIVNPFVGMWLLLSSSCFLVANNISYIQGDHFVMNIIDILIMTEVYIESFVDNAPIEKTKGFNFYGRKPAERHFREAVSKVATATTETMKDRHGRDIDFEKILREAFDKNGKVSYNFYEH